jgi:hypothetical protein
MKKASQALLIGAGVLCAILILSSRYNSSENNAKEKIDQALARKKTDVDSNQVAITEKQKSKSADPRIELSEKGARILKMLLADDIKSFSEGIKSEFETGTYYAPLPVVTTASRIQTDYERNEVAGDKKYRDKEIIVNGRIASINRSFGENYFISFSGSTNSFLQPQARFAKGYTDFLSNLKKNQKISLFCTGAEMSIGSAVLNGCIPLEKWQGMTVDAIFNALPKLIEAEDKKISTMAIFAQIFGDALPEKSPCLDNLEIKSCQDELNKFNKNLDKSRFEEAAKKLGIKVARN